MSSTSMTNGQKAVLLTADGYGIAEFASRTAYDSFNHSEHNIVRDMPIVIENSDSETFGNSIRRLNDIPSSKLLEQLVWAYHHESILEHIIFRLHVTTSRGVLQELSRHRIMSQTVKSSRYTMTKIINAYVASEDDQIIGSRSAFESLLLKEDMFCVDGDLEIEEINSIYNKLVTFENQSKEQIADICLSREAKDMLKGFNGLSSSDMFDKLNECKAKRNAGDKIKFVVSDMW